jgi:molybdopterin adenylyltransferase
MTHHKQQAPASVRAAVLTISDSRTPETDQSGGYLRQSLLAAGHEVADYRLVKDDGAAIRDQLLAWIATTPRIQVILTTGGTGIAKRDNTIEVVTALLDKPLPGFGEVFRMLSYQEVRGAAILSRATAGMAAQSLIFAMPGSLNAVETAWKGILGQELAHLVYETVR